MFHRLQSLGKGALGGGLEMPDLLGQVGRRNQTSPCQGDRPLYHVFQFPDIAGKRVLYQHIHCLGRETQGRRCIPVQEETQKCGYVLTTVPQGRDLDLKDPDAVEEILPEPSFLDHLSQIPVGGRNEPDVHIALLLAPYPADLPFLDRSQELGLKGEGHLADLVQHQCAPVGQLKSTSAAV